MAAANRSAAAKKGWITRRGSAGSLLSAASSHGAVVNKGLVDHIRSMSQRGIKVGPVIKRMPIQGFPRFSASVTQRIRQQTLRQHRIGNVNAVRIARGQQALVFKDQGKPHRWPRRFR